MTAQPKPADPSPQAADEAVFGNPWQARAFALAVALNEAGHLDWSEWTRLLGEEISTQGAVSADDSGEAYYACWIAALEKACSRIG